MVILVKGYTKNMCDKMFNQMKRNYTKRNDYRLDDTYKILDLQDNVASNRQRYVQKLGWSI